MDMLGSGSIMPMFTNTVTSWNNRLVDLFIDWRVFIILIEIKLIIDLKILSFEIKKIMTELKQIFAIKRIQDLLDQISLGVSSQELKDTEKESFANAIFHVDSTQPKWTITFWTLKAMTLLIIHRA